MSNWYPKTTMAFSRTNPTRGKKVNGKVKVRARINTVIGGIAITKGDVFPLLFLQGRKNDMITIKIKDSWRTVDPIDFIIPEEFQPVNPK